MTQPITTLTIKVFCLASLFSILSLFAHQQLAHAVDPFCDSGQPGYGTTYCEDQRRSSTSEFYGRNGLIYDITQAVILFVGVIAVIGVIYGGFMYVTAGGDASQVAKAKNAVIYSLVGLGVAILAREIVVFVLAYTNPN